MRAFSTGRALLLAFLLFAATLLLPAGGAQAASPGPVADPKVKPTGTVTAGKATSKLDHEVTCGFRSNDPVRIPPKTLYGEGSISGCFPNDPQSRIESPVRQSPDPAARPAMQ
jgi:hypothetical protein